MKLALFLKSVPTLMILIFTIAVVQMSTREVTFRVRINRVPVALSVKGLDLTDVMSRKVFSGLWGTIQAVRVVITQEPRGNWPLVLVCSAYILTPVMVTLVLGGAQQQCQVSVCA